jgi:carbamoyl-phosphate synthase large subunit
LAERDLDAFGYEKLDVWQLAMKLAKSIYTCTNSFPKDEQFGITSQLRRAAISVPSNIAEGYGLGEGNFVRHLQIAIGSVFEIRTQILLAIELGLSKSNQLSEINNEYGRLGRMLHGLVKSRKSIGGSAASR